MNQKKCQNQTFAPIHLKVSLTCEINFETLNSPRSSAETAETPADSCAHTIWTYVWIEFNLPEIGQIDGDELETAGAIDSNRIFQPRVNKSSNLF